MTMLKKVILMISAEGINRFDNVYTWKNFNQHSSFYFMTQCKKVKLTFSSCRAFFPSLQLDNGRYPLIFLSIFRY